MHKSFLKFAGGKYRTLPFLLPHFTPARTFIEPFCGSGVVWLNTDYEHYIIADSNPDLIDLFNMIKYKGQSFIDYTYSFFGVERSKDVFNERRTMFNTTTNKEVRAALFVYLNRHCFNGLCRYNASGKFNAPYGKYDSIYFPRDEMTYFYTKAQSAEFMCLDFRDTFKLAEDDSVVYCDPPYKPISDTSSFTSYTAKGFGDTEQAELVRCAQDCQGKVIVSNSSAAEGLYDGFQIIPITSRRNISASNKGRGIVKEIIAVKERV